MTITRPRNRRLLLTADAVGGVWQYATDLARELAGQGFECVLALLGPEPTADQRAAARAIPGATLVETGLGLDWLVETPQELEVAGRRIAELGRHLSVDLIQVNHPALIPGVAFPAPVVAVAHSCLVTWWDAVRGGEIPDDYAWRAERHGAGLRAADLVVTPSAAFAAATQSAYGLEHRPAVVRNGRIALGAADLPQEDFAFTAGRLWDAGKAVATLDRAAARLAVPFRAAGPVAGPQGERQAFAHLDLLGRIDEAALGDQLARRPVFASAALYEPFGLAVLEAAAAGCALVLADIPTFRELWSEAATFVVPGDDVGFAAAIEALIADPAARAAAGERARVVARRYTPAAMAEGIVALYARQLPAAEAKAAA